MANPVFNGLLWLRDKLFILRFVFPRPLRKRMADVVIEGLASRRYLRTVLLPALAAAGCRKMLFVGVRAYNLPLYADCRALQMSVWTIDIDPAAAEYGAPAGHFVGDIRQLDLITPDLKFDAIVFNGIIGFGINSPQDAMTTVDAMAKVAAPGAILLVGWNPGLTDGQEIDAIRGRLSRCALGNMPTEVEFPASGRAQRYPHRYEIFRFGSGAAWPAACDEALNF